MKTACAWCKTVMRDGPLPVSHGICEVCAEKAVATIWPGVGLKAQGQSESLDRPNTSGIEVTKTGSPVARQEQRARFPGLAAMPAIQHAGAVQCRTGPSGPRVGQLLQSPQVQPRTFTTLRDALIAADMRKPGWWHLAEINSGWSLSWSESHTTT